MAVWFSQMETTSSQELCTIRGVLLSSMLYTLTVLLISKCIATMLSGCLQQDPTQDDFTNQAHNDNVFMDRLKMAQWSHIAS